MNEQISPVLTFVGRSSVGSAALGRGGASSGDSNSWYEAMSRAWGQTLDVQAAKITNLSDIVSNGGDKPSNMVMLTAESLKIQFMSTSAATSQNSVGKAIESIASNK